ncbi:MAG: thrombospondin type 3 repeat-containing protein [Stagnimonas sp.]|nr:thrombospondin type 3 repeat-containing protein [Stagnimonas sp.]
MTAPIRRISLLLAGALFVAIAGAQSPYMVDGDGDLVSDEIDDCPYTHPGVQVDSKGCPVRRDDSDLDGLPDDVDDCPYSTPGAVVDQKGCALDTDFDGVANGIDRCPKTPLALPVNAIGCAAGERPDPAAAPRSSVGLPTAGASVPAVVLGPIGSRNSVNPSALVAEAPELILRFHHNSARLGRSDLAAIKAYTKVFARRLMADSAARLHISAYADAQEPDAATLAAARMAAVRAAFSQEGIAADRIQAENAVQKSGTAARNRRVVTTLTH